MVAIGLGLAAGGAPGVARAGGYDTTAVDVQLVKVVTIENSAMLDATGKPYDPPVSGAGINYHSTLHRLLAHTYVERGRKITFKTDAASEAVYRKATQQFPRFPFGYYALALSLRARGDAGWRDYAQQAVGLFEKTTAMANCNESHFAALKELRTDLAELTP
jgi:hypothetical protein